MTQIMPQTQEWIDEIVAEFRECSDLRSLVNCGVNYLRMPYVPTVVAACWKEFVSCTEKIAPGDSGRTVGAVDLPAVFHAAWSHTPESPEDVLLSVDSRMASIVADVMIERDYLFVATDGEQLVRRAKFQAYKSSRPEKPAMFKKTLQRCSARLAENGYRVLNFEGWESDDILASVSYRAKLRRQKAVLVTDDRDSWQCLGMGTVMYSPRTGVYTSDETLMASHRITPRQAVDWWCLVGGKNDVPSAAGIGEKIASDLLSAWGTFHGIYDVKDTLTPAKSRSIDEFSKENYWIARELHTLNRSLEIHW